MTLGSPCMMNSEKLGAGAALHYFRILLRKIPRTSNPPIRRQSLIRRYLWEISGCGEREFGIVLCDIRDRAMRAAGLTGLGTVAKRPVNDRLDGARAAAAFGAATETAIDLFGIAQRVVSGADGMADIVVAEDVAGADDHETELR